METLAGDVSILYFNRAVTTKMYTETLTVTRLSQTRECVLETMARAQDFSGEERDKSSAYTSSPLYYYYYPL